MKKVNIGWEEFEKKLGEFAPKFFPFWENGGFDRIYSHLKERSKMGVKIAPEASNTFKWLEKMNPNNILVVVVGLSPYHTLRDRKYIIASGIPLDCSLNNGHLQPSLSTLYTGIAQDLGIDENLVDKTPDISFMLDNGIFLVNIGNTVEIGKAGCHSELWKEFTEHLFNTIIAPTNAPCIFLGREVAKFKRCLLPFQWSFEITHPASIAYSGGEWDTQGVFKKVSKIVKDMNGIDLKWLKTKNDETT